jgi:hypothetical protein
VIASHDYYPFGEEITASSQDTEALKFTGHERDLRDPTKTTDDLDYMHTIERDSPPDGVPPWDSLAERLETRDAEA